MSRRAASDPAATSNSAPATPGSSRTSGCGSAKGRSSSAQPRGVAQRSQSTPADGRAATVRSAKAITSTPVASPVAMRLVGASWLATAPTPANTGTTETIASAR
jgi:hypothetical protein